MAERRLQENPACRLTPCGAWSLYRAGDRKGFTLIELIIATAISALVMGILSVCFSFALRVWQSTQDQKPDFAFPVAELLKSQLAECNKTPIRFEQTVHSIFIGKPNAIAFVTDHSVRAISQGVPVVVRYTYDPDAKILYYSELLLDPYHSKSIEQFLSSKPSQNKDDKIRSYGIEFPEFVLAYAGEDSKQFSQSWDSTDSLPKEVFLRWRGQDSRVHAQIMMTDTPFSVEVPKAPLQGAAPGGAVR